MFYALSILTLRYPNIDIIMYFVLYIGQRNFDSK